MRNVSIERQFGQMMFIGSDLISYAAGKATVTIQTPTEEQVLIIAMVMQGGVLNGTLNTIDSLRMLNTERILSKAVQVGVLMQHIARFAQSSSPLGTASAAGLLGVPYWHGDERMFLRNLEVWARGEAEERVRRGKNTRPTVEEETRFLGQRAVNMIQAWTGGSLSVSGFVVGGVAAGPVEIELTDLNGGDEIERIELIGLHLGNNNRFDLSCEQNNTPLWHGHDITFLATPEQFSESQNLTFAPAQVDRILHVSSDMALLESTPVLANNELSRVRVAQHSGSSGPSPFFRSRIGADMFTGGQGAPSPRYFEREYHNQDRIGWDGEHTALSSPGALRITDHYIAFKD